MSSNGTVPLSRFRDLAMRTERLRKATLASRELAEERPSWCYPAISKAWRRLKPGDTDDDLGDVIAPDTGKESPPNTETVNRPLLSRL